MANEGGVVIPIIKNPGVHPESHVHLVPRFKLQSHAIGCCLVAVSSCMVEYSDHLHPILHESQPHWSRGYIMAREAKVIDSFDWSCENTWGMINNRQCYISCFPSYPQSKTVFTKLTHIQYI